MSRNTTPRGYWPNFESDFLSEIVINLRKKGKSLKKSVGSYTCERIIEEIDGIKFEKLEMSFHLSIRLPIQITFICWDDRWLWIDIRQPSKSGWKFEWRHEGRIGAAGPVTVANLLLRSVQYPYNEDYFSARRFLDEQWKSVAVVGPRGRID